MISLRYHAVSIAAVFLALAVGVVLGSSGVSDRVLAAVSTQRDDLSAEVTRLTAERDVLAAQQRAAGEFASRVGPAAVRGLLAGQTVALVVAGTDTADRDGVVGLIGQAGGTVTGLVELTDAVGDPARADQLRELTSQLLPAGAANLVLVLTGGARSGVDAADASAVYARLAAQLDLAGAGAVLAGADGSADATGAVGVARADPQVAGRLSTVDDVQSGSGRVATVLALHEQLEGRAGSYGTGPRAVDGAAPAA